MKEIGKVQLNKSESGNNIIISPAINQSSAAYEATSNWIRRNFKEYTKTQSPIISISKEDWQNSAAKKFVKNIADDKVMITWEDLSSDKDVMKGHISPPSSEFGGSSGGMGMGGLNLSSGPSLNIPPPPPTSPTPAAPSPPTPQNANYEYEGKITFQEYLDRVNKNTRKSGIARRMGIKTVLGNPRLNIPRTGSKDFDYRVRYKDLGEKF